jgi:NTP pyrophosphatase (non-canonical NTP hydrolase)
MEMKELLGFINWESDRLREHYNLSNEEAKMRAALKIPEEVGELMDEILKNLKLQRKEKMVGADKKELEKEIADVILTTMILAKIFDVDIEKALEEKIAIVRERNY